MEEDFEDIKNNERYQINRNGDIRCKIKNKLIGQYFDKDGYKICCLNNKSHKIHRLLAKQFILNNDPLKTEIDHIDRNRSNNSLANLRWSNRSENCRNRSRNGCISTFSGFRKNGEPYTSYRGSYTIPNNNGGMKTIRRCSCKDKKIVEEWLEEIKKLYP